MGFEYCPKGHELTFVPQSLVFGDCYYCKSCDKIFEPTIKEVTKEWFKEHFHSDRFNDIKRRAEFIEAKEKVTISDLKKLGYLSIFVLIFLPCLLHAQYEQPKLKSYVPSIAFTFASGVFKELREASMFYRIKTGGFFDGRESWRRKYKNGDYRQGEAFPLSTSALVMFTDNVHFSQMMYGQCEAWSEVMQPYDPNRKFSHLLLKVMAKTAIEGVARTLTYQFFKNGNRR